MSSAKTQPGQRDSLRDIRDVIDTLRGITRVPGPFTQFIVNFDELAMIVNIIGAISDCCGAKAVLFPNEIEWLNRYYPKDHAVWNYVRDISTLKRTE